MKKLFKSNVISIGLAIFSMFFGAGNLMYPIKVGMKAGSQNVAGITGFLITAMLLPLAGLIGMILFDGNYQRFFDRLGRITGSTFVFISIVVIGPLIAIPRIVTLSHTMIAPFLPFAVLSQDTMTASFLFSLIFLGITFLGTFRENNIVDLLGYVISPLLLISLAIIIIKGFVDAGQAVVSIQSTWSVFTESLAVGYETLDLLGAIFFSAIILNILRLTMGPAYEQSPRMRALLGLKAGLLGVSLLGIVYVGMSYLGVYHGYGLGGNVGELFRDIAFRVLGNGGAAIIGTAVLMACLSTSIALSAVVAEYLQHEIFRGRIEFLTALTITLVLCIPLSTAGLDKVIELTGGPIVSIGYPMIITLTLCNIAYKAFGFKPVKIPVLLTFLVTLWSYIK